MIKRALISVWNKSGLIELAMFLQEQHVEIISTGGTRKVLLDANIKVKDISDITNMGSLMDGRVKTLHPKVFGGILADRNNEEHILDLSSIDGELFDLIVVNFYPFVEKAVNNNLDVNEAIEYIDIGGPSMLRAAAKNFSTVIPLSDPKLYDEFIETYKIYKSIPYDIRRKYATEVFKITSEYEMQIYTYLNQSESLIPDSMLIALNKIQELRYGENPHQESGYYIEQNKSKLLWKQHQGKKLSYNNFSDMETAINTVLSFEEAACAIIKHENPCGFGIASSPLKAYKRAVSTDPISYFGGIVSFNREIDDNVANELIDPFLECIIAPSFTNSAIKILSVKKNLRVISIDNNYHPELIDIKSVLGGYLVQEKDQLQDEISSLKIVTTKCPTASNLKAMELGWKIVKSVKSNGIVIANEKKVLGIGAGQMSRIDSLKIAIRKLKEAGLNFESSILASDAFFPFSDCVELAAEEGILAIIQPGGSIKDKEIISTANKLGIVMAFTGIRHFYH